MFEVVFDYGEHDRDDAKPNDDEATDAQERSSGPGIAPGPVLLLPRRASRCAPTACASGC